MTATATAAPTSSTSAADPVEAVAAATVAPVTISLPILTALDQVWARIRVRHPEVPDVVLTLGAGSIGTKGGALRLGHFAADRWEHADTRIPELFVGGEGLKLGAEDVLATLLHEAAHGLAHVRGVRDTSRQGRFHNTKYRALAEELGLTVAQIGSIGWSDTKLSPAAAEDYTDELVALREALTTFRHAERQGTRTNTSNNNGVSARCECGRRIRIAASILAAGPIVCGLCDTEFHAPEDDQ